MPTDAQRRNLASAHHAEVQALKDKIIELEKQLENAFSAINYWKEQGHKTQSKNNMWDGTPKDSLPWKISTKDY